jgi:hypothetical protein
MQCKKVGLRCGGYDKQPVFVMSTPDTRRVAYSVNINPHTSESSWQRDRRSHLSTEATSLRLLARPEDERRCINLFWESFFPSGSPITTSAVRSYTCTWTESARKLSTEDDSLRYSLWANCLLVTGKRHGTAWMLRESSRSYGKALACLRRSLSMPPLSTRDSLIATVKLLNMFEVRGLRVMTFWIRNQHVLISPTLHSFYLSRTMAKRPGEHRTDSNTMQERLPCSLPGLQ